MKPVQPETRKGKKRKEGNGKAMYNLGNNGNTILLPILWKSISPMQPLYILSAAYKHWVPAVCIKSEKVLFMPHWNMKRSLYLWAERVYFTASGSIQVLYSLKPKEENVIWQILTQFWIKQLIWLHFMWLFWKRCMIMLCLWPECCYCSILYSHTLFLNYLKEIIDGAWQVVLLSFTRQDFQKREMP